MRKTAKKLLCLSMAMAMGASTLVACGANDSDRVAFWVRGTSEQLDMYDALVKEFNKTYGAEHGIEVTTAQKPESSYDNNVLITAGSSSGPDIFLVRDENIKSWITGKYFSAITSEFDAITDIDLGADNMDNAFMRLRYNEATNSSNPTDPLYGVPVDVQPTALYYNESKLLQAGIIIISVDEKDMDAWNAGTIADKNGVWKKDISKLSGITVPKKGFYRNQNPYYYDGEKTKQWVSPSANEVLVFNNRIAMNWDEVEDISMLFTAKYNPKQSDKNVSAYGTTYGYFTEWWFNYAWSVGGDCLTDLTGNSDFNFSLLDPNPNYVVVGESFTGRTGTVYQTGETIEFLDKMNISEGETLVADDWGDYLKAGGSEKAGVWSGITEEMSKADSALAELPSTKEAFLRYLKLGASTTADIDGDMGIAMSPNPTVVTARGLTSYFLSQEVVFVANTSTYMSEWAARAKTNGFEWDLAPLVQYKRYTDPSDAQCDEVEAQGKAAGHSDAWSLVVRNGSSKREKAVAFLKWVASVDGQKVRAASGFFPTQKSLINEIKFSAGVAPSNVSVFSEALDYQTPGDWWYMKDKAWVEKWCADLNASLRNGKMTYTEWLNGSHADSVAGGKVVVRTNNYLKNYKYSK